ncbi:hypothetical protein AB6A40_007678 [Gnathostoma spinigerum]|uniref:Acetyltransferase component of pyruvate dehydrogenase complex n=1 Tax=Gnathostoma spinigerum TaxID=75299 RepID=A0ABD6ELY2_9BILA
MEKGTLVSWQKKEGDELAEGDVLCEIETDKATMSFETPEEGYLAKILVPEGTKEIPVGQVVCVIVDKKESIGAFANYTPASMGAPKPSRAVSTPATPAAAPAPASRAPAPIPPSPTPAAAPAPAAPKTVAAVAPGGHVAATPYARKLAAERGVNLANIRGSGPGGRVLAADVEAAPVAGPPPPQVAVAGEASLAGVTAPVGGTAFVDIPLTNMRGTIAKRLLESKTTIPHYYLTSEILVDELMKIRKKLNELLAKSFHGSEKPPKISINDFIIKASALACMRVPEANSFFMGDFIRQNTNVDVSVAVSTDTGLITPIIFNANSKGLAVISQEIRELAAKAREGKLQPPEFQGGTFTVSNLGMYGSIHDFTAIINPPQSCILAVGGTEKKVVPDGDEGYKTVVAMNVTLSCDHRVVDGAIGAQWLKHFKSFLEKPHTMLL